MSRMHLRISRIPAAALVAVCLTLALLLASPVTAEAASARPSRLVVAGYSGEQLANARVIVGVAAARHLPLAAAVLGVATAMGESSLRNLAYGDDAINPDGTVADSVGLFQQQHWWGSRAERMTPAYAAAAFFAHLVRVHGWQHMTPTAAIHRVQGNADPTFYSRFVPAAVVVVAHLLRHPGDAAPSSAAAAAHPSSVPAPRHGPASPKGAASSPHGRSAVDPVPDIDLQAIDQLSASDFSGSFPADGGVDLKGLAADVAAAAGTGDGGGDGSSTDWATEWDLGSADEAISGAFTDGFGSDGGTVAGAEVPAP